MLPNFHIRSQGMQKQSTCINLLLWIDIGPNSTLKAREYRNMKPLSVCFKNLFLAKFSHKKPKNAGTSNFISSILKLDFGPNFTLLGKEYRNIKTLSIHSQGMQDNRNFINSVVKMDLGPNSTFQAKECKNIKPYQFVPKN